MHSSIISSNILFQYEIPLALEVEVAMVHRTLSLLLWVGLTF